VDLRQYLSGRQARTLNQATSPSPPHLFTPRPHTSGHIGYSQRGGPSDRRANIQHGASKLQRDVVCTPRRTHELSETGGRSQKHRHTEVFSTTPFSQGYSSADPSRRLANAAQRRAWPVMSRVSQTDAQLQRGIWGWGAGKQPGDRPHTSNVTKRVGSGLEQHVDAYTAVGWLGEGGEPTPFKWTRPTSHPRTQSSQSTVRLKFTKLSEESMPKSFVWEAHEELEGFAEEEEGGRRSMRDALQAFPSTRTDLLTVYTDQCGLQVCGVFFFMCDSRSPSASLHSISLVFQRTNLLSPR
jgi:hypothetical protein